MNKYRVTAEGSEGSQFVYTVEAETEGGAVEDVYATHGQAMRSGLVTEWLTPWNGVELIESGVSRVIRDAVNLKF